MAQELQGFGQAGPSHPTLGIPMDITVGLRSPKTGAICSLAASFNNHGPIISDWRFIAVRVLNRSFPVLLLSTTAFGDASLNCPWFWEIF